jgi:hypothetical protein
LVAQDGSRGTPVVGVQIDTFAMDSAFGAAVLDVHVDAKANAIPVPAADRLNVGRGEERKGGKDGCDEGFHSVPR